MPPNLKLMSNGTLAAWRQAPQLPARREVMGRFFPTSPLPRKLGIELAELSDERAVLRMPFDPANATVGEVVHGGAIAALVDTAGMAAAWADDVVPRSLGGSTATMSVDYLAPASGCELTAVAGVSRRARWMCIVTVEVHDPERTPIATGVVVHRYV